MKAKHSVWKSKLAKTMFLATVVLVAALFLGTAASAGLRSTGTGAKDQNNIKAAQEPITLDETLIGLPEGSIHYPVYGQSVNGLAPHPMNTAVQSPQAVLGDRGYFYAYNAYDPNGMNFGPVTFDSDAVVNLLQGTGINFISGSDFDADGNWYMVGYSGGLYQVNPDNGDMTLIANTVACDSLVYDSSTGIWYVSSGNALYTMDITNGATTFIGSFGTSDYMISLMCDVSGNMYGYTVAFSSNSNLYSIDKTTGAATVIGSMGHILCYAQEGKFDRNDGTLYIAAYDLGLGQTYLATCDPDTGALTVINQFSPTGIEIDGFSVPYSLIQYDHDAGIKAIKKPASGNAGVITPEIAVKNYGLFDDTIPVECKISKKQYTVFLTEDFEGSFPPAGWTVQTIFGGDWHRNDFWSTPRPNVAGTGYCADADMNMEQKAPMLTLLTTSPMDLSTASGAVLDFDSGEYTQYSEILLVDVSVDGGATWANLWQKTSSYVYGTAEHVQKDMAAYGGYSDVRLRFGYFAPYNYDYWWEVDNVMVRSYVYNTEYDQFSYPYILSGQTMNVTFPDWTPADLGLSENVNVEYKCNAQTWLATDQNPNNDAKEKKFTLHYGYFDDVAITSIPSPISGLAQTQTPQVVLENHGQNPENVNVNMQIGKITTPETILYEDFSGGVIPPGWGTNVPSNWYIDPYYNYAGGVAPEMQFNYYPTFTGDGRFYTAPIDTTGIPALLLSFKEYVNNFNGDYTLKVQTSSDGVTWTDVYTRAGGAYGPTTTQVSISGGSPTLQIAWDFFGYSYNINYWYIDDVQLDTLPIDVEYDQTVTTDINPGATQTIDFPPWTPSDIPPLYDIQYVVTATATLNGYTAIGSSYGFEDYVPPSGEYWPFGWTMFENDWIQSTYNPTGATGSCAELPYSSASGGSWFMSPAVDTTGNTVLTLNFANYIDWYSDSDTYFYVETRANSGDSWTDVTPWANPCTGNIGPGTYSIDISGDIGTGTQVRFEFAGYYFDFDYWYIDDVSFGGNSWNFETIPSAPGYLPGWTEEIVVPDPYGSPTQWYTTTQGLNYPSALPHSGTYMEEYNCWDVGSGAESRLKYDTPFDLAATGYDNIVLKFWMYYYGNYGDYVDVQASLDGSTWTSIGHFANDGTHGTGWVQNTVDLSAYSDESTVYLAFLGHSNYMYNIFIDDISLAALGTIPDGFPSDNTYSKMITLSYEHDVGVAAITEPTGPILKEGEGWLQYDNGVYSNAFGSTTGEIYAANRFTSDEVGPYVGWKLDSIMWNHYDDATCSGTVKIFDAGTSTSPGPLLTSEDFTVDGAGWYNITLTNPVTITGNDIWLCTDIHHLSGQYPDTCSSPGISTKTAWFSSDGATWYDLPSLGYDVAFMLRGHVTSNPPPGGNWPPGTYPVQGIIENFGPTFSESNFDVNTQVTNATGAVVYDQTVTYTGTLAPGASAIVNFPDITIPADPAQEGAHKLTMKTMLAGDSQPNNDKKVLNFVIQIPDTTAPVTTAALSGTIGQAGWYVSDVTVTLTAIDPGKMAKGEQGKWPMGVNHTYYIVDGGTQQEYTAPFVVSTDSVLHTILYWSVDKAVPPNVETQKSITFKQDKTAPVVDKPVNTKQNFMGTKWLITVTASDATSGIVKVEFYVDDVLAGQVTAAPYEFQYNGKIQNHTQALVYDAAGNTKLSPIAYEYSYGEYGMQSAKVIAKILG